MKEFRFALIQIIPILMSYIFVGLACGILMSEAGYSPLCTLCSALFIYAGSMQIVLIGLMSSGVALPVIAAMTLLINARHIFYGIGFIEDFKPIKNRSRVLYSYMVLTMTDETYSVLCSLCVPEELNKHKTQFFIQIACHSIWVISCTLGAIAGNILPFDMTGIDFAATALFSAVVANQWMQFKSHIPVIVGALSAILFFFILGPDGFILPALALSTVALTVLKDRVLLKESRCSK